MSPTAAMLILGHHMKPTPQVNTSPSPSPPVFQVKASAVKWVLDYVPIVFKRRSQTRQCTVEDQSFTSSDSGLMEKKFREVLELGYW